MRPENELAIDHFATFDFFASRVKALSARTKLSPREQMYTASILAHYSQVSMEGNESIPLCTDLSGIYDNFVMHILVGTKKGGSLADDSTFTEAAGAQTLFLVGFFRDQMEQRHNLRAYEQYGQTFYGLSAQAHPEVMHKELFDRMAENFHPAAIVCCELHRMLRHEPYLLKFS